MTALRSRIATAGVGWLAGPPTVYLLAFFVLPMVVMVGQSVFDPTFTLGKYQAALGNEAYRVGLRNSLTLATMTMVVTSILGNVLVWGLLNWGRIWKASITLFLLLPLVSGGELVRILAWMIALSPMGPIGRFLTGVGLLAPMDSLVPGPIAVLIGLSHILLPFYVFVVYSAARGVDRRAITAAQVLGANRGQAFLMVALPMVLPALLTGMLLVFLMTLGYYATPAALGAPSDTVLPTLIANQVKLFADWAQAAALGMLLLVATLVFAAVLWRIGGLSVIYTGVVPARAASGPRRVTRLWGRVVASKPLRAATDIAPTGGAIDRVAATLMRAVAALILAFLATPLAISIPASLTAGDVLVFPPMGISTRWYDAFFASDSWRGGMLSSIAVAVAVAILATALATGAALALTRGRFRGKPYLFALLIMPLIMPWTVPALGLYFESVVLGTAYTPLGLVIGQAVVAVPYALLVLTTTLAGFDWTLERAARMSGAGPWRRLVNVFLPLLQPAVLSALLFTFLASFTEFLFAFFMSDVHLKTLPVQMWEGLTYDVTPTVAAAGGVLTFIAVAGGLIVGSVQLLAARRAQRRARLPQPAPSSTTA